MSRRHCLPVVIVSLSMIALAAVAQVALPPEPKATAPAAKPFAIDSKAAEQLEKAEALLQDKKWDDAKAILLPLLDAPENALLPGKDADRTWVSPRIAAERLFATLPDKYRTTETADSERRADGALDRGDHHEAAALFRRLLRHSDWLESKSISKLVTILRTVQRTGDSDSAEAVWKALRVKVADRSVRVEGRRYTLDELRTELDRTMPPTGLRADWPISRGDASRSARAIGGAAILEPSWSVSTLPEKEKHKAWVEDYLKQASQYLESRGLPVLPAFHPLAVQGKVLVRTYDGFHVVNLDEPRPDFRLMGADTDGGAQGILGDPNKKQAIDPWKTQYLQTGPHGILFENSVNGTLSTDGKRAMLVDDLILPPNSMYQFRNFGPAGVRPNYGHLNDQAYRNSLKGYDLESFKLFWDLGGKSPCGNAKLDELLGQIDKDGKPIANQSGSFFLGPPLPLDGKLYVLNERDNELRLLCLEPRDKPEDRVPPPPELAWHTKLLKVRDGIESYTERRIHAAHLAYGEGVLVCPTNAGHLVGVDLLSHRVLWVHAYREEPKPGPRPNPNGLPPGFDMNGRPLPSTSLLNEWKNTAPAVVAGKIVFASPDGPGLVCLDLHDGKLLWKINRTDGDLYFAGVFDSKAVIVNKDSVRAVRLDNGKEAWSIPNTGLPSGQGVASGDVYYLPVKSSAKTKEPEIAAIDVAKGAIVAQMPARTKGADGRLLVPGNLIFYEGQLISQTLTGVVGYPLVQAKQDEIDKRLKDNPNDPKGRTERGMMRRHKGDLIEAAADFRAALANDPPADVERRARDGLFDTLTQLLERDFPAGEKFLDEYKGLCRSDDEAKRLDRQATYLVLLAKGREKQGRTSDALQAYHDFAALPRNRHLVISSDQPHVEVRPDVSARGRIAALMARATPEQRKTLEASVAERWKAVRDKKDMDALCGFVDGFGTTFAAGREARLVLAERLLESDKKEDWSEAEQLLLRVRAAYPDDTERAGRAVEALARLMIRENVLEDALFYYHELGRNFPETVIKDGKTGAILWKSIETDKRFQPLLEAARPSWKGNFKAKEEPGNVQMAPAFSLEPVGDVLPFFARHRLSLDTNTGQVRFIERGTDNTRWNTAGLPINHYFNNFIHGRGVSGQQWAGFTYSAQGHVVVISLGHMVYAFDPVAKRKLWEYNLFEPGTANQPNLAQVIRDRDGSYRLFYTDGWAPRLGQLGPVGPGFVCVQSRKALIAFDPVSGAVLWTRSDVSPKAQLFGDDQFIYVVDVNAEGKPTSAKTAVRAADGVSTSVPDFAEVYERRQAIRGRLLLASETLANGEVRLRLYDVQAGKDVWHADFPAKTVVLRSANPDLAGVVDPEGAVSVFDLRTRKEPVKATVKKEDLEKLTDAQLLTDRDLIYVLLNQPPEPIPGIQGGVLTNFHPSLSTLTVNGPIYAFERASGKMRWMNVVTNQQLLLEQFDESPLLLFSVKYAKLENQRIWRQVQVIEAFDKRTGKCAWPPANKKEMQHNNQQPFHALRVDPEMGTVVLEQFQFRMRFTLEKAEGAKGNE